MQKWMSWGITVLASAVWKKKSYYFDISAHQKRLCDKAEWLKDFQGDAYSSSQPIQMHPSHGDHETLQSQWDPSVRLEEIPLSSFLLFYGKVSAGEWICLWLFKRVSESTCLDTHMHSCTFSWWLITLIWGKGVEWKAYWEKGTMKRFREAIDLPETAKPSFSIYVMVGRESRKKKSGWQRRTQQKKEAS